MTHRSDVWPKVLSGGEAQRASLARALVRENRSQLYPNAGVSASVERGRQSTRQGGTIVNSQAVGFQNSHTHGFCIENPENE